MFGVIIGDIAGSRFELDNCKSKEFELFDAECCFTDDTVMSLAICDALMNSKSDMSDLGANAVKSMQTFGRRYPRAGYGGSFRRWIFSENPQPYNSWGNGAAMRVSACGLFASDVGEAERLSRCVTEVTHNHPEAIRGAQAAAAAVFLAKSGRTKQDIREYITDNYYRIDFTIDEIREHYSFDVSCQGSVPQALEAFFESTDFEDCIRTAVSVGGDSDTIAAIAGSIAEAYYGIDEQMKKQAAAYLDEYQLGTLDRFEHFLRRRA